MRVSKDILLPAKVMTGIHNSGIVLLHTTTPCNAPTLKRGAPFGVFNTANNRLAPFESKAVVCLRTCQSDQSDPVPQPVEPIDGLVEQESMNGHLRTYRSCITCRYLPRQLQPSLHLTVIMGRKIALFA